MPQLIRHIEDIALDLQRDVLYVCFPECSAIIHQDDNEKDWRSYQPRIEVTTWLDDNGIRWEKVAAVSRKSGWIIYPYDGSIYIDYPFDREDPQYMKLEKFMEHSDGTMKINGAEFCYKPPHLCKRADENP